jgi:hypothetical protein
VWVQSCLLVELLVLLVQAQGHCRPWFDLAWAPLGSSCWD